MTRTDQGKFHSESAHCVQHGTIRESPCDDTAVATKKELEDRCWLRFDLPEPLLWSDGFDGARRRLGLMVCAWDDGYMLLARNLGGW